MATKRLKSFFSKLFSGLTMKKRSRRTPSKRKRGSRSISRRRYKKGGG